MYVLFKPLLLGSPCHAVASWLQWVEMWMVDEVYMTMNIDYSFKKHLSLIWRFSQNLALTSFSALFLLFFWTLPIFQPKQNTYYYQISPAFFCLGVFVCTISSPWNILLLHILCYNLHHFKFHNILSPNCGLWDPGATLKEYRVRSLGDTGFKGLKQNLSPSPSARHSQRFLKPNFPSVLSIPPSSLT